MTPKPTRTRGGSLGTSCDADLLAGLWQEAPFARLPPDAPPELEQYVHDIENPNRVYAIHLASRRHDFQLWVERYNLQLRVGCGQPSCTTATCFTCRKRLAGKVPIRRYNSTSARTLAVYLASQDNPQDGLCPHIRLPREAPTTSGTLIFSARSNSTSRNTFNRKATVRTPSTLPKDQSSQDSNRSSPFPYTSPPKAAPEPFLEDTRRDHAHVQVLPKTSNNPAKLSISVTEKQVSKDHRSFAANLFGTVAFKMLEWLTPRGVDSMSQQITSLDGDLHAKTETSSDPEQTASRSTSPSTQSAQAGPDVLSGAGTPGTDHSCVAGQDEHPQLPTSGKASAEPFNAVAQKQAPLPEQNSTTPIRPDHCISTETPANHMMKDHCHHSPSSPRVRLISQETPAKFPKTKAHVSTLGILDNFFPQDDPSPPSLPLQNEGLNKARKQIPDEEHQEESKTDSLQQGKEDREITGHIDPVSLPLDSLPQSLSRLNVEIIDFICNVFQEDGTTEGPFSLMHAPEVTYPRPQNSPKVLTRRSRRRPALIREQWKAFNEQTIFSVLSDPQAVLQSFTSNGRLYDSHTLWYCLHRMAQVSPSLVYHSLWIAAGSLFDVPHQLQRQSKIKTRRSRTKGSELSGSEAGHLMSICMHALVAAAPCAPDSRSLYEMSRIRSNGLALANGGFAARQPPPRCLDYNDAFSNELMIRLARRLFLCITSHIYTKKATSRKGNPRRSNLNIEILAPLLNQLDFLGTGSTSILQFPENEKLLHETRVPTILLDWARTILLTEWNGLPDFSTDGPFAGALSFIEALHKNRNLLFLGDSQFRVDFLSDRLDSIQLPVDWLAFKSTQLRRHILDYPYIFSADTLVSFFRSINFARMSRMFEESSSLKTRMNAIVDPGSLITNPHHKTVLQDLLDTASSKYLILEIGRDNVVQGAFDQLWRREKRELLRPLKVHLGEQAGEEGFDSGGVQQEFFRLAVSECLDPTYGAFTVDEMTRMAWFSPGSLVEDWKYELVGLLVSLAIYNGLTLPVTFPKALYRKLLGNAVEELHHIADGWSDLAKGLTALLEWNEEDGSIEDVFSRTYEFSVAAFGHNVTREMSSGVEWPKAAASSEDAVPPHTTNPADAPLVTSMNRDAYVSDYIRYLTDVSVRSQYLAFERGFRACLDKKSLSLLNPSTLQSLVEGIQEIDIPDLRRHTRYVGWDASHHTIRDFWSIVKRYDLNMKRRLLEFVTSSDRVPVGGMKNLQFVIQKNGEEESNGGHLPTAYTCYGTLLLPEYRTKELLKERLAMALENSQGFGFA